MSTTATSAPTLTETPRSSCPATSRLSTGDFRYQLTVIGQFAQAIVTEEVKDNHFSLRTDKPNVRVSWQVAGIPTGRLGKRPPHRGRAGKAGHERGRYLAPEEHGQPATAGLYYAEVTPTEKPRVSGRTAVASRVSLGTLAKTWMGRYAAHAGWKAAAGVRTTPDVRGAPCRWSPRTPPRAGTQITVIRAPCIGTHSPRMFRDELEFSPR
jgi:hypothetical protein